MIIPTRNRPEKLRRTISCLQQQSLPQEAYEIVVVDDGSEPPVTVASSGGLGVPCILRLTHGERSAARNSGAEVAAGELVAFVDDDMIVAATFLQSHVEAHEEWSEVLAVGAVSLPESALRTPFGRFRATLELGGIPAGRGIVNQPNFCTATNMSLSRKRFLRLGGFDPNISSAEDQDLAMRHIAKNGRIAFIPEARGIHDDDKLDIRSYCQRAEWGAEHMIPFVRRHQYVIDNRLRVSANGPIRWGRDSVGLLGKKLLKRGLGWRPALEALFLVNSILERLFPESQPLTAVYRLIIGVHLQRGFRRGWARSEGPVP